MRFIPYANHSLEQYNNQSVHDVLSRIAALIGTFLYLTGNPVIKERVNSREILLDRNKASIEKILRLSFFFDSFASENLSYH
jgi:hypothetical protein